MTTTEEKLLIVDDDPTNRDVFSRMLRRLGYSVAMAEDGERALQMIHSVPYDLVLLDNMMPGLSGVEVLERVRQEFSPSELPVIMVTAQGESGHIVQALQLGANDYVTKPVDYPVVSARISSQLSRRRADQAIRESEQRYALAARGTNDGLWDWDLRNGRVYFSPRWKQMLGYAEGELSDSIDEWFMRVRPGDLSPLLADLRAHREGQAPHFQNEHRLRHKDGSWRWVRSRGVALRDPGGQALRIAGSQTDVTGERVTDHLTGLPNRLYFLDRLERALEQSKLHAGCGLAMLFCDLDGFQMINNSLGHEAGDEMLTIVGRRLRASVRADEDVVARFGGDEFGVLLETAEPAEVCHETARRILATVGEPTTMNGRRVFPSLSIGIVCHQSGDATPADILRNADTAMYYAKARGKSRYEMFETGMRERTEMRLQIESDLREALEREELVVYYQPKFSLGTGWVTGFEALVRWRHPARGLIAPAEFIPIAEETGLIVPLGAFVLRTACRQLAEWNRRFDAHPPLSVAVNVSARQFRDPGLVASVREALAESGLDPQALCLEVTESVVMENMQAALQTLKQFKSMQIGLHMDDFGTGYSSLKWLSSLPFDALKVDQAFVRRMETDTECLEIVRAVVSLAHSLEMRVIAGGIETHEQFRALAGLGCEFGQGFLFSAPVPAGTAEQYLASHGEV
jgi:diguanylate cyclase (GGDEF)-like protein/PAS domain S-box-containing protein